MAGLINQLIVSTPPCDYGLTSPYSIMWISHKQLIDLINLMCFTHSILISLNIRLIGIKTIHHFSNRFHFDLIDCVQLKTYLEGIFRRLSVLMVMVSALRHIKYLLWVRIFLHTVRIFILIMIHSLKHLKMKHFVIYIEFPAVNKYRSYDLSVIVTDTIHWSW